MYILDPSKSIKFPLFLVAQIIYMVQHDRQHLQWLNAKVVVLGFFYLSGMTTYLNSLMALFHSAAHKLARHPELMKVNTYLMLHRCTVSLTCCFFFIYSDAHMKLVILHDNYKYYLNVF